MPNLAKLVFWETLILLGGFFGVIFWKILTGGISLQYMLCADNAQGETSFSPGRAQALMVTLMVAVQYVLQVISHPTAFPQIPEFWIIALAGSHAVYLGGKARSLLFSGNKQPPHQEK